MKAIVRTFGDQNTWHTSRISPRLLPRNHTGVKTFKDSVNNNFINIKVIHSITPLPRGPFLASFSKRTLFGKPVKINRAFPIQQGGFSSKSKCYFLITCLLSLVKMNRCWECDRTWSDSWYCNIDFLFCNNKCHSTFPNHWIIPSPKSWVIRASAFVILSLIWLIFDTFFLDLNY